MRRHHGGLPACLAALAIALAAPAVGSAKPGALDRGFSGDGKVVTVFPDPERARTYPNYALPYEFAPGRIAMAGAPSGKLVTASSQAIVRYLANGRRDPGFGGNGAVPVGHFQGLRFQLADVAVDSRERVLVAGTVKATDGLGMAGPPVAGPIPSFGMILRYNPNGQLDSSFGAGGVINSHFGAPPPTFEGSPYPEAAVSLVGLAVDPQDRPVVTGSAVVEVDRCGPSQARYEVAQGFVARLAVGGGADPSFAGGASAAIGSLSWLGFPAPTPGGLLAIGADANPCRNDDPDEPSVVASIGDTGLNTGFGGDGFWSAPFTRVSNLAVAPSGKVVLLARTVELKGGEWVESAGTAVRLKPDGAFDRSFGQGGRAELPLAKRAAIAAIATDAKGRVLLAGHVERRSKGRKKRHASLRFLLIRLTRQGELDRSFGRGGRVTTSFGPKANARATEVLVDPANRIAVGGPLSGPATSGAFALARYLSGR